MKNIISNRGFLFLLTSVIPLVKCLLHSQQHVHSPSVYTLTGTPPPLLESYLKFPPWAHPHHQQQQHSNSQTNTTLTLEFLTITPNSLLLYTDDSGTGSNFFELKLVESTLKLRFNLGSGSSSSHPHQNHGSPSVLTLGRHLNDNHWHRVEIRIIGGLEVVLVIDGFLISGKSIANRNSGKLLYSPWRNEKAGAVWVGGVPGYYVEKLDDLTLPSVVWEPRFRGGIRNVVYSSSQGGGVIVNRRQDAIEWKGLLTTTTSGHHNTVDPCERHDPCLHGGFCISTDDGPVCDCRHIDFEGSKCETDSPPSPFPFSGLNYIHYDFIKDHHSKEPIVSTLDEIGLYFRKKLSDTTSSSDTYRRTSSYEELLFYTGSPSDYLLITLRDGRIGISVNLGSGPLDAARIHPDGLRFDDGLWHELRVVRKVQEMSKTTSLCHITASIDGLFFDRWTLAGSFTLLTSSRLYVGGYDYNSNNNNHLPGINKGMTNFVGCMKKVEYRADSLRLKVVEMALQNKQSLISVGGSKSGGGNRQCDDNGGIGGTSEEENSVVGESFFGGVSSAGSSGGLSGEISSVGSSGGGFMKHLSSSTVTFTTPESFLVIPKFWNDTSTKFQISMAIRTTEPNGLILFTKSGNSLLSITMTTGQLYLVVESHGINKIRLQITQQQQSVSTGLWHTLQITLNNNRGTAQLNTDPPITFNTKSSLQLAAPIFLGNVPSGTQAPQIWTINLKQGFVGCLKSLNINGNFIDVSAVAQQQDSGSVRSGCHVGSAGYCASNPCLGGGRCGDGWGRFVCECGGVGRGGVVCQRETTPLILDGSRSYTKPLPQISSPMEATLLTLRFHSNRPSGTVATLQGNSSSDLIQLTLHHAHLQLRIKMQSREKLLPLSSHYSLNDGRWHYVTLHRYGNLITIKLDDMPPVSMEMLTRNWEMILDTVQIGSMTDPFSGKISNLILNNDDLLLETTSFKIDKVDQVSISGVISLGQLKLYHGGSISLWVKGNSGGVVFYNGGGSSTSSSSSSGGDFIAMEISELNGVVKLLWDNGNGIKKISCQRCNVADGAWHFVELFWGYNNNSGLVAKVTVDQERENEGVWSDEDEDAVNVEDRKYLDLNGVLYLGGAPTTTLTSPQIFPHSPKNFIGCLATLEFAGEYINPLTDALSNNKAVGEGCRDATFLPHFCTSETCKNGGICSATMTTCDCGLTTFTGVDCSVEPPTYLFTTSSHLQTTATVTTLLEKITLGLITLDNEGIILKIESQKTTDFFELFLFQGKLKIRYNFFNNEQLISTVNNINNGEYHKIAIVIDKQKVKLLVNGEEFVGVSGGSSMEMDNSVGVWVGNYFNQLASSSTTKRGQFKGAISGLTINSMKIMDMLLEKDPHVRIVNSGYGNVINNNAAAGVQFVPSLRVAKAMIGSGGNKKKSSSSVIKDVVVAEEETSYYQKTTAIHPSQHHHYGSQHNIISDDLLVSSGDIKCSSNYQDDEDCDTVTSSGISDDLITPVYIPSPKPPTTTTRKTTTTTTTNIKKRCQDDEDDCIEEYSIVEGSGSHGGEISVSIVTPYNRHHHVTTTTEEQEQPTTTTKTTTTTTLKQQPTTTTTTTTTQKTTTTTTTHRQPQTFPPNFNPYPSLTPLPYPKGNEFDFDPPKTTAPRSPHVIPPLVPQIITTPPPPITKDHETIYLADGAGDSTLIIIIIIAVLMIIIVSILIIFFMCKRGEDPVYKVGGGSGAGGGGLMGGGVPGGDMGYHQNYPQQQQILYPQNPQGQGQGQGGPRKTGVKEWYV